MRSSPILYFFYKAVLIIEGLLGRRHIEGAQMIILRGDEVMLIKTTYRPHWEFPGGAIDKGESAEDAAIREAQEEAGIVVSKVVKKLGTYMGHAYMQQVTYHVFLAGGWMENNKWASGFEIAERQFFPLNALPLNISPGAKKRLEELAHVQDGEFSGDWV